VAAPGAVAENAQYARWAEDQASKLEKLLAAPLPAADRFPIEMVIVSDRSERPAVAVVGGRGASRRLVVNAALFPEYDLLQEGLCAALLATCVEDRQAGRARSAGDIPVPQWFSMGVAQNLAAETRACNRKIVTGWTPRQDRPGVVTVLRWGRLPEGWPRNRALCGMVACWLSGCKDGGRAYAAILDRLAGGEPVDADWVASRLAGLDSAMALEPAWQDWLDRQGRTIQEFGALSSSLLEQLRSELDLTLPAGSGNGPASAAPRRLTPSDVQAMPGPSAFVRVLADEKARKIRFLTLGKAPELIGVGEGYALFYEGVARGLWSARTKLRLKRADAAFNELAALTRAREAYLDAVEAEQAGAGGATAATDAISEPLLEKGPIGVYLDAAEKRYLQSEQGKGAARRP
jgi:hypothetical protein